MSADPAFRQAVQKFLDDGEFRQKVITTGREGGTDAVAQLLRDEGTELTQGHLDAIDSIGWDKPETDLIGHAQTGIHQDGW